MQRFPDFKFEVVWLTAPPRPFGMDEQEYAGLEAAFKACEAIAIKIPGFSSDVIEEV